MPGDSRLFILATVDRLGEASGHDVVREATQDRVQDWAHVSTGALYSALRKLEVDGHLRKVRDEKTGNYPQRSIYTITPTGTDELTRARTQAWHATGLPMDPFDLALSVSDGADAQQLQAALTHRLLAYQEARSQLTSELQNLRPYLEPTALAVIDHMLRRYDTEIAWHSDLLVDIPALGSPRPARTAEYHGVHADDDL